MSNSQQPQSNQNQGSSRTQIKNEIKPPRSQIVKSPPRKQEQSKNGKSPRGKESQKQILNKEIVYQHKERADNYLGHQKMYFDRLITNELDQDLFTKSNNYITHINEKMFARLQAGMTNIEGQLYHKVDIEEELIDKRIKEMEQERESLQKQLQEAEKSIQTTVGDQRLEQPRSLYGHPVLKYYMESENFKQNNKARQFIQKIKQDQVQFQTKINKLDDEKRKKQLLMMDNLKQKEEKDKKEYLDHRKKEKEQYIQYVQQRKVTREKEMQEKEDEWKKKIKKITNDQKPLFIRLRREYNYKEKQELLEKLEKQERENLVKYQPIDSIDFEEHERKFFEQLKQKQEERKLEREKKLLELMDKQPLPNVEFTTQKGQEMEKMYREQWLKEHQAIDKEKDKNVFETRKKYSEARRENQVGPDARYLSIDNRKRDQLELIIDRTQNPKKYIKRLERKKSEELANDHYIRKKKDITDEMIWRGQVEPVKSSLPNLDTNNISKQLGLNYLKEVKESVQEYKLKNPKFSQNQSHMQASKSYQGLDPNLSNILENMGNDKFSDYKSLLGQDLDGTKSAKNMRYKPDYMDEVRKKYNLDKKLIDQKSAILSGNTNALLEQNKGLDPSLQKERLDQISKKLEEQARRQEQILKYRKKTSPVVISSNEIEERSNIDDMYFSAIKAKLAVLEMKDGKPQQQQQEAN